MKNVLVRLREYKSQASGAEKNLIGYLLDHPEEAVGLNARELAEKTYTSASTVTRFCRKLGFDTYKEFTYSLNYEIALRTEERRDISGEIGKDDTTESIIDKVTYGSIQALEDTRKLIDPAEVQACVEVLRQANSIGLFGIGSSLLAAKDMYLKFLRLNKSCICNEDLHSQIVCARNLGPEDAAILFSYSGLTRDMLTCAEILKDQHVPLITVTRFAENEMTRWADHKLYVSAKELLVRAAATTSRIAQLNVIDILFAVYMQSDYDKHIAQLRRNLIAKDAKGGGAS
ncbi:MAG: MurR/RpiR family transcriptional regulator [Eubacteriales bacterium]|nr:MurR/RpiR family transcriptional regulator [Eubacteriales bacterium]